MIWEELREEEFDAAVEKSGKLCVIPIGALEMHGEHLPVGTDNYEARYVCVEAAKLEPVVVFPNIMFGNVPFLTRWKGSIRLTVELMQAMLTEICAEIARNGFKKILIVNGHGGNPPMLQNFVSSTQHTKKDYVVMCRETYHYGINELAADIDKGVAFPELNDEDIAVIRKYVVERWEDGHAGLDETCTTMAIRPDLVRLDRMYQVDGLSTHAADYLNGTGINNGSARFWYVNQPNQYCGHHPEGASARIGQVLLQQRIKEQAETCRLLKMDDRILDWNDEWNNAW